MPPPHSLQVYCFALCGLSVGKPFPINNLRTHGPMIFKLCVYIGHDQSMASIDFEVTRTKVKVTMTLNALDLLECGNSNHNYILYLCNVTSKFRELLSCQNRKWLVFATSLEPGQSAHLCSLSRLYTFGCPT